MYQNYVKYAFSFVILDTKSIKSSFLKLARYNMNSTQSIGNILENKNDAGLLSSFCLAISVYVC